eukprot:TRINITY_DN4168_c0_g1_i1.p1 TRINITY_DN4168_c0_g1~~TRINITY_DN4168_c0_g1_i1.p1  ORF type:complete len:410 (-),score=17.95 TRINITY_DN4168_c0_g1_i1:37-1266(-)
MKLHVKLLLFASAFTALTFFAYLAPSNKTTTVTYESEGNGNSQFTVPSNTEPAFVPESPIVSSATVPSETSTIVPVSQTSTSSEDVVSPRIVVAVVACNRPEYLRKTLGFIKKRMNVPLDVVISLDCGKSDVENVAKEFSDYSYIKQPDLSRIAPYAAISRHYKWMLDTIFSKYNADAVIMIEDDLEIAVDFFDYMLAMYPLVSRNPNYYCVSAWNDNGMLSHVNVNDNELFHVSEFFPGLGWMITKSVWKDIGPVFPSIYWDDGIRNKKLRKDRVCIRPEISRSKTFGKQGVSGGQFFDTYLAKIQLNDRPAQFTEDIVESVKEEQYWVTLRGQLNSAELAPNVRSAHVMIQEKKPSIKLVYKSQAEFTAIAKDFKIMNDFKDGVPRTGYKGVVQFTSQETRVYVSPF